MPEINILSPHVADLIAAGEVVERPASVIKELLENCIDAGATSVTAEIKNGGITYMRVTDNGCGIDRNDVYAAFLSHATSKISSGADLDEIGTLGFRGEALASVAAVSRVELLTRTGGDSVGTRYVIEGGEELLVDDAGCPQGTTILVRDLFYNTPARMKFLKKDVSEANAVAAVIDRIALSHPEVAFRFIREGKQTLSTAGDGKLGSAVYAVFGREFFDGLIETNYECDGIEVCGFISKPTAARANRSMQLFFLNGRMIRTGTGSAALCEGYKNSIMVGKYPACVLNIRTQPYAVDVNVHPAKLEVRFANEKPVFNAIYYAVKNAISSDTSHVRHEIKRVSAQQVKNYFATLDDTAAKQVSFAGASAGECGLHVADLGSASPQRQHDDGFSHLTSPTAVKVAGTSNIQQAEKTAIPTPPVSEAQVIECGRENPEISVPMPKTEKPRTEADVPIPTAQQFRLIGEAFKTYLLAEAGDKILVIDKHAAHERILYEKLRANDAGNERQLLLTPLTVTLDKLEYSAVLENLELLADNGFCVEDFGGGTVLVSECPLMLAGCDITEIMQQLAGYLAENRNELVSDKEEWIYHSVACRAAIKAGDFTGEYEAQKFVERLLAMPDIRCCPHGRPVMNEITRRELEKSFGRV